MPPRKRPAAAAAPAAARTARSRSPPPPASVKDDSQLKDLTALLLGLERRPDRRKRCEDMLSAEVPWLKTEFFRASDGKVDTIPEDEVSMTWNTKNNSNYGSYEDVKDKDGNILYTAKQFADPGVDYAFSPGERGCAHSHYRMWKRVLEENKPMLILEDDVQLIFDRTCGKKSTGATFTERFEKAMVEAIKQDADVLYLGWSGHRDGNYKHHTAKRGKKNPLIRKAEYVWTTVAYVLWPKGAKKLLEKAKPMDQPVDNFMGWECREGRLNSWVVLDEGDDNDTWAGGIVTQLDFNGDSDIKKSDGGDQGDDPTEYLAKKKASEESAAKEAKEGEAKEGEAKEGEAKEGEAKEAEAATETKE